MKKLLALTLALILALMTLAGCGPKVLRGVDAAGNQFELQGDTLTVKGEDGDVTIAAGGNLSWPKDKTGDLPELSGNVTSVIDTPGGVSVTCDGISKADYDAYLSKLRGLGYETTYEMTIDENTMIFMGEKDGCGVSVQLHLDGGKGACIIVYGMS